MKVLNFKELHEFLDSKRANQGKYREQLESLQNAAKKTGALGSLLKGQGAEALKERYESLYVPLLERAISSSQAWSDQMKAIKSGMSELDDENAVWKEEVLANDVPNGLTTVEDAVEESVGDIESILSSIDDLVEVPRFHMDDELDLVVNERSRVQKLSETLLDHDGEYTPKVLEVEDMMEGVSGDIGKIAG